MRISPLIRTHEQRNRSPGPAAADKKQAAYKQPNITIISNHSESVKITISHSTLYTISTI